MLRRHATSLDTFPLQVRPSSSWQRPARWLWAAVAAMAFVAGAWLGLRSLASASPVAAASPAAPAAMQPGTRLALPALNVDGCRSSLTVQNAGSKDAKALLIVWGNPGTGCVLSDGPLKAECSGLLKPGSSWTFVGNQLALGARSGLVYSLNATNLVTSSSGTLMSFADAACRTIFFNVIGDPVRWLTFDAAYRDGTAFVAQSDRLDFGANPGEPLAVRVERGCPDKADATRFISETYAAIAADRPITLTVPGGPQYAYAAPSAGSPLTGTNTVLRVQNVGTACATVEVDFKATLPRRPAVGEGSTSDCSVEPRRILLSVLPGETTSLDVAAAMGVTGTGAATVTGTQPLSVVVDQMGPGRFAAYSAPRDGGPPGAGRPEPEAVVNYVPLAYHEYAGWNTRITVQNLSATTLARVKFYFLDREGDIITTIVDEVCPLGNSEIDLKQFPGIPANWVGQVRVESVVYWPPNQGPAEPPRLRSVVHVYRESGAGFGPSMVAYTAWVAPPVANWPPAEPAVGQLVGSAVVALPVLLKAATLDQPSSDLAIVNLVTQPGHTDFALYFFDQNGLLDYICQRLIEKEVDYIDLVTFGYINPGFRGSAIVSAVSWDHSAVDPNGGPIRKLVSLAAVVVDRARIAPGVPNADRPVVSAYEGIPILVPFRFGVAPSCFNSTPTPRPTSRTPSVTPTRGTPTVTPTLGTATITVTPTRGTVTVTVTPTRGTPTITPTLGTATLTPTRGTVTVTPTRGTPTITPTLGTATLTPTRGTVTVTPTRGTPTITPTLGTATITPTRGTVTVTPTRGTVTATISPTRGTVTVTVTPTRGTVTVTPTRGSVTATPTRGTSTPGVSPESIKICAGIKSKVPAQVLNTALSNPSRIGGWGLRCNPSVPANPLNTLRLLLTLSRPTMPYHPLFNGLVLKCSCQ